jgi:putative FmdB family regulatory protein
MPIYEYSCKKCGNFEVMQGIKEDPLKKCPTCNAKVTKMISRSAFHLKGSGWYMTDYAKTGASGPPNENKSEETKSATSETKDSKSSSDSSSSSSTKDSSTKDSSTKDSPAAA